MRALNEFKQQNGLFPQKIIVYRDGVSDGQKRVVLNQELCQIKSAIEKLDLSDTKIMLILVNKRINTRLFSMESGDRLTNPLPGTVIDYGIVRRDGYDFYLVSQRTRQGVATPTHYTVVYDDVGAPAEQIISLTYKLCYTYYNVAGSIRVPAPIQYAHRLANLIGDRAVKVKTDPFTPNKHLEGKHSLFYI